MVYSWYEEDFAAFILKHDLPAYNREYDIVEFFNKSMTDYINDFDAMLVANQNRSHPVEFYDAISAAKPDIVKHIQQIKEVLDAYEKSDYKTAQEIFDLMMSELNNDVLLRHINGLDRYYPKLYRVRRVTSEHEKLENPKDLFHIPYTKRQLITNERYSLAGYPCLYLASYLGIAWQECGYPGKFYYSEFQYQYTINEKEQKIDVENEWKFITILRPQQVASDLLCAINPDRDKMRRTFLTSYVKSFPLFFVCSIVNLSGDSTFKPEFIVPQMLMQWVRRNIDTVRGIHYFSCTDSDDLRRINGYNIAIPAVNFNEDGLCLDLINKFKVSIPLYCDNLIDKEKHNKISAYKKDLISSMNGFTSEAIPCASDIYEICNCFDHLMLNASKMNMKLVIQTLFSIRTNCRYIQTVYKKDNIREKSLSHAHRTDQNKCIELFEQYYDMFFSEIEPIISRYIYEIEKIGAADFTDFYSIN